MLNRVLASVSVVGALLLTGCATPTKMAFQEDSAAITAASKPIFLMTATLKNGYRDSYQPEVLVVNVERKEVKDSNDRINFTMDEKAKVEPDPASGGKAYLLRLELDKGEYVIRGMTGFSGVFPIRGHFFSPLHAELKSADAGVYYLGHVEATVRERQEGEFRAGPPIPLIDQAATGFSGGTFDVAISDQLQTDEAAFRAKFPALRGVTIKKAILPAFDRAKAQKWWEEN
jgi:hypothetical protein